MHSSIDQPTLYIGPYLIFLNAFLLVLSARSSVIANTLAGCGFYNFAFQLIQCVFIESVLLTLLSSVELSPQMRSMKWFTYHWTHLLPSLICTCFNRKQNAAKIRYPFDSPFRFRSFCNLFCKHIMPTDCITADLSELSHRLTAFRCFRTITVKPAAVIQDVFTALAVSLIPFLIFIYIIQFTFWFVNIFIEKICTFPP